MRVQQARPHACGDLLGRKLEVEGAPIITAAVNGDLLERLNQTSSTLQVRDELFCGGAAAVGELDKLGAAHLARGHLVCEVGAAARQRRRAGADRAADFVRYPGDKAAQRRESFGFDEIALCFAGVQSCFGQPSLVPDFGKQCSKNRCADRHK